MYNDYFLKFADEAEATAMLFDNEMPKYAAIDTLGVIYRPTGNMLTTDEGEVPEMVRAEGWHVNVRHTEEAPDLEPFAVTPLHPKRNWA